MSDSGKSILVVDDDQDIASNMSDILSDLGYNTDIANDGEAALELVRRNAYDIALLDFRMPGMDGATLYEAIKRVQPNVVAIMVTAYAGSDGAERARSAGTWKVMRKPVDFDALLGFIEHLAN